MPVVAPSTYRPPFGFANGHMQTVYPVLFRRVAMVTCRRERIHTPDGDFLDLDWDESSGSGRLVILSHGLEGSTSNSYVQGMAGAVRRAGWDVLAWHLRGCSGEPNSLLRAYHSGATEDLRTVVDHAFGTGRYERIDLVGFSLGGNMTLKYLGELGASAPGWLGGAVAFSVPCDLASSSLRLERPVNRIYMERFLRSLRVKIREKVGRFPGQVRDLGLDRMRSFRDFDGAYTAPLHGFESAEDYWEKASSKPVLNQIVVPTLLVNARDDPFLADACFPMEAATGSEKFYLETPDHGGHVGFVCFKRRGEYWSESRAIEFLSQIC